MCDERWTMKLFFNKFVKCNEREVFWDKEGYLIMAYTSPRKRSPNKYTCV